MSKINLKFNKSEIMTKMNDCIAKAFSEIGITETASIQANTPVDSGTLKKSRLSSVN